jgi:branched-chain amino acid transport system ATP-binding protein
MLRIEGLSAGYSAIPVLRGVSIKVDTGQFVAIVGPNGAGKTTLFKTISGTVRPSGGAITFEHADLLSVKPAQRAHLGIAHVPEGRQVFPSLTVMENLEMGAITEAGRRDWKQNIERIFEWLPVLAERRGQFAGTLSGGQQQMLAIGRGLMSDPRYILLDEPSLGLAPQVISRIFEVVVTLRDAGKGVLLVEQNGQLALGIAQQAFLLEGGTITLTGTGAELLANSEVIDRYLGVGAAAPDSVRQRDWTGLLAAALSHGNEHSR